MQRIIAYIYKYKSENDILTKCCNVGFCRVEEINNNRVINMCFKETRNIDMDCLIKGLYIDKEITGTHCDCLDGKVVGNYKMMGGQMRLRLKADKEDGLIIEAGDNKYVVLWSGDKESLRIKKTEEKNKSEMRESLKEEVLREQVKDEKIEENFVKEQSAAKVITENKKDSKEKVNSNVNPNTNLYNMLERVYNRMAKVPMYIEGQMLQAVKLQPQQMAMLPRKYWHLTNNGFLMECFYIHKHILFFKYKGGFVLGAPARVDRMEEMCAAKYGFQEKIKLKEHGTYGREGYYWLMILQ